MISLGLCLPPLFLPHRDNLVVNPPPQKALLELENHARLQVVLGDLTELRIAYVSGVIIVTRGTGKWRSLREL